MEDYKRALGRNERAGSVASRDPSPSRSPSRSLFRRGSNLSTPSAPGYGGPSLLQVPSRGSWRSGEGSQAPPSPTSIRTSQRPGTGDSEPLVSVAEAGVVVPNRSTSRRKRTLDPNDSGKDLEAASQLGNQSNAGSPSKVRDTASVTLDRNVSQVSRRTQRRDASGALSGFSGGTSQKTVTLAAALRAEALEEERRHTLKERLAAAKNSRKKRNASRDASAHLEGLEEANADEEDDEEDGTIRRRATRSSIMARYEARHLRREKEASEFGQLTPQREVSQSSQVGDVTATSASGYGLDRSASGYNQHPRRFRSAALGVLSLSRAGRATDQQATGSSVQMQELRAGPTTKVEEVAEGERKEQHLTAAPPLSALPQQEQQQQQPQRPQPERSITEVALPAEASRASALDNTVEVPADNAEMK